MNNAKRILIETFEAMSNEQADKFLKVFTTLRYNNLRDVCEGLEIDLKSTDFARPKSWTDKAQDLGINTQGFIWSYQEDSFGEPMNLNNRILEEIQKYFATI